MSNSRKGFTENYDMILFEEVDGVCPKCTKSLIATKGPRKFKKFQKAHIYPLNPTHDEIELLKNEERLSTDVNDIDNLIALCTTCHDYFDNPRTIDEYRKMVEIKKRLIDEGKSKEVWSQYPIESEINEIISELATLDDVDFENILELNPKDIDSKTNSSLTPVTKRKIKTDVSQYFNFIKDKLKEVDALQQTSSELIAQQIKTYYLKTALINSNQEEIYHSLVLWLFKKTNSRSIEASNIIISFFIQNCEVF